MTEAIPNASNAGLKCGGTCDTGSHATTSRKISSAAQASDSTAEKLTTRRDDDSAASIGMATSQTAANDEMPPELMETAVTSTASDSADIACARSYCPVRDR